MEPLPPFYTLPPTKEGVGKLLKANRPISPLSQSSEERRVLTAFCDRHLNVGRWEKLVCDCSERVVKLGESDDLSEVIACYEDRAGAWGHLNKWERAVSDYTSAIESAPTNPRLLAARANANCMLSNWRDAINDCTQAIRSSPTLYKDKVSHGAFCAAVFGNRAAALRMLGLFDKSVEDCTKALSLDPTKVIYHMKNRYLANRALGNWSSVINDLDSMIRLDPLDPQLWIARGVSLGKLGQERLQDAKRSFNAALHLDPQNASALLNRGVANGSLGDWAASLEDCENALLLDDKNVMAWRTLGHAKSQLGRLEDAVVDFTKALVSFNFFI
jgi:tetratricopeptide (TPR) repeat protein